MDSVVTMVVAVIMSLIIMVVLGLLIAFPIMWLWNGVVVAIFGLPAISWVQALGLYLLSGFLVKSTSTSSN